LKKKEGRIGWPAFLLTELPYEKPNYHITTESPKLYKNILMKERRRDFCTKMVFAFAF
jgi:hypothetical protein